MGDELFEVNPKRYRELSVPFEDKSAAEKASNDFFQEVLELRNKYRIPDVLIALTLEFKTDDGNEGECCLCGHFGDALKAEMLAAYAFGYEQSRRQDRIAEILKHSIKVPRRTK